MIFNLNTQLVKELPEGLAPVLRGLYYGDALFETIRVFDGRIPFIEQHCSRLFRGMELMGYVIPDDWCPDYFHAEILRTAPSNARVRLTVWRSPGGLYFPEDNTPQFLIQARSLTTEAFQWSSDGLRVGLCTSIRLAVDRLSGLKAPNAPRYVAASQEARSRGWDDAVILNAHERVCEATSSNIFWMNDGALFTPPLSDGCVTGVMRELLLALTKREGYAVSEKSATFADLLAADELFLTNAVSGIRPVVECEGKVYGFQKTAGLFDLVAGNIANF